MAHCMRHCSVPRRARQGDAALWRYAGAVGRAWRVHAGHAPPQVRELHVRLLLGLRDTLLPHLGHGGEADQLVALLAALAGRPTRPAPATPAAAVVRGRSVTPPRIQRKQPAAVVADTEVVEVESGGGMRAGGAEKRDQPTVDPDLAEAGDGEQKEHEGEDHSSDKNRDDLAQRMRKRMQEEVWAGAVEMRDGLVATALEAIEDDIRDEEELGWSVQEARRVAVEVVKQHATDCFGEFAVYCYGLQAGSRPGSPTSESGATADAGGLRHPNNAGF